MRIYFATNEKYYSRLFRYLFTEPVSHVGVGLYTGDLDLVADCTKPHGKLYHLKHWLSKYRVVYFLDIKLSDDDEKEAYKLAADELVMVPYDWGAYYYGFFAAVRKKLFGIPYPPHNKYQKKELKHCTESLAPFKKMLFEYGLDIRYLDLSAHTPHMIGKKLFKETSEDNPYVIWSEGGPYGKV